MANELTIFIDADTSGLRQGMAEAERQANSFQSRIQGIADVGQKLVGLGSVLTAGLTLPIIGLGAASVKAYGDIQALQKGLEAVMGSAASASTEFEKLKEVAKLPGLGLKEAAQGSVSLQAAGFSADQARKSLMAFGNALVTVGKGANEMNLVILALTQLQNKSSGFGQDLRQLTEQLPQLRGALTEAFGTADSEAIAKSGRTGKQVVEALTKEFEKLPKVTGGIKNAFENLGDNVTTNLARIGKVLDKNLDISSLIDKLTSGLDKLVSGFENLSPEMQGFIITGAGVAAAIGPILVGLGAFVSLVPTVVSGIGAIKVALLAVTGPIGVATLAIAGLTTAYFLLRDNSKNAADYQKEWASSLAKANVEAKNQVSALDGVWKKTQDLNLSTNDRKIAIDELRKMFPAYFKDISNEAILNGTATKSYNELRTSIVNASRARAAQAELDKRNEERLQTELKLREGIAKAYKEYKNPKAVTMSGGGGAMGANMPITYDENQVKDQAKKVYAQGLKAYADFLKQNQAEDKPLLDFIKAGAGDIDKVFGEVASSVTDGATKALEKAKYVYQNGSEGYYEGEIKRLEELKKRAKMGSEVYIELTAQIKKYQDILNGEDIQPIKGSYNNNLSYLGKMFGTPAEIEVYINSLVDTTQVGFGQLKTVINEGQRSLKEMNDDISKAWSDDLSQGISSGIASVAASIGTALSSGGSVVQALGKSVMSMIGNIATQLGQSAIAIGVGMIAIKAAFKNPFTAIAAGVALVALGSFISGSVSKIPEGGGSGVSTATGGTGGTTYSSNYSSGNGYGGDVVFRISGNDLVGVLARNQDKNTRLNAG